MKLDAWLRDDHSLDAKLRVIERLCQAVNSVHDGGEALAALEPSRIEIGPEGRCDLSDTQKGSPAHAYRAPDREGGAPLAAADIYAVGAIAWEILAGRPPAASPAHLAEVQPTLERELADAVMACLQSSAEWRPKDLTYLAQMAAARQKKKPAPRPDGPRAPLPPRVSAPRSRTRRPRRRTWPLVVALGLVGGLAVVAGRPLLRTDRPRAAPVPPTPPTSAPSTPTPPAPTTAASPSTEPPPATGARVPEPPAPPPEAVPRGASEPPPSRTDAGPDSPLAHRDEAGEAPIQGAQEPSPPSPLVSTPPVPEPRGDSPTRAAPRSAELAGPVEPSTEPPPMVTAISPLVVRRPGKVLIDLHGTGFRPGHRARVLPVKKVPWGITVVRQKLVGDSLLTILLDLKGTVEPGEYALTVEDGLGSRSEPVVFEVTR